MLDLKQFCSKSSLRPRFLEPWSAGEHCFASNGHIIVRVPRRSDIDESDKAPKVVELFANNIENVKPSGVPPKLDKFKKIDCTSCAKVGSVVPCPRCDTIGCGKCNESGCVPFDAVKHKGLESEPCCNCDGNGTTFDVPGGNGAAVQVDPEHFIAIGYLDMLLSLPNVRWSLPKASDHPIPFWFEGGDGLLMPMRVMPESQYLSLDKSEGN